MATVSYSDRRIEVEIDPSVFAKPSFGVLAGLEIPGSLSPACGADWGRVFVRHVPVAGIRCCVGGFFAV